MRLHLGKIFLVRYLALVLIAVTGFASNHSSLNGTWKLMSARTDFAGEPVIQTGTVTISDRQHNIYISRDFTYEGTSQTISYNFTTDSRENGSIRQGKSFKTKAKWDDRVLTVTTVGEGVAEHERYSLDLDGTLILVVERAGHPPLTLHFER